MRIWDLPPVRLCRQHLLGEHRELHALWSVLNKNSGGYINHPETKRWIGKRRALFLRHEELVREMNKRGYKHLSPLDEELATGKDVQEDFLHSPLQQMEILREKGCSCRTGTDGGAEKSDRRD